MFVSSNLSAGLLYVQTEKKTEKLFVYDGTGQPVSCPILAVREEQGQYLSILDASALQPWSPDTPVLYTLRSEAETVRFGHTEIRTMQNKAVLLNGAPIYLRGYIRGIIAHDHPNMTGGTGYDAAVKNIRQAKKYGFNLVRFHSTIPSEAFVQAADELGILIHMEIGFTYEGEGNDRRLSTNNSLWLQTLERFRNHPSVAIFCIGNEMHNSGHYPEVQALYEAGRRLAPNKLILDNSGWGEYDRTTADIYSQHIAYYLPYGKHGQMFQVDEPWRLNGSVSDAPLELQTRQDGVAATVRREAVPLRPVLSHEAVHYIDIPDYDALNEKFDAFARQVGTEYLAENGIKKPRFLRELPELIRKKGLQADMPDYIAGSRAFRLSCTKVFLEKLRLSSLCGYEMLQFSDCLKYENKNGIVDCFDDDKGIDPDWMMQMNGDLVLLAEFDREVFREGEEIRMNISASDFLPQPEIRGTLQVWFADTCIYEGQDFALAGGLQKLAEIRLQAPQTGTAHVVPVRAVFSSEQLQVENSWKLWIYPQLHPVNKPVIRLENQTLAQWLDAGTVNTSLVVTDVLDIQTLEDLQQGKTVLLFYEYGASRNQWQMPGALERCKPCIWDRGSNLGGIVRNPLLQKLLVAEPYFDLNLYSILEAGTKVNLDNFPCSVTEHFRGFDKPVRDRMKGLIHGVKEFCYEDTLRKFSHLFSLRVGAGNLIVCTLRVSDPEEPVTASLLTALVDQTGALLSTEGMDAEAFQSWLEETNRQGFRREDVMNHFWELDNKPVEDTLFWEAYGIDLASLE